MIAEPVAGGLATAYHEAGHAVMAQLCGQSITRVEIIGDERHSGSCSSLRFHSEPEMGMDPAVRTAPIEAHILCLCAGMVAEALATGRSGWDDGSEELDQAVRLAMRVVRDCERVLPYLRAAREHTEQLLRQHWSAVDELALALLARGALEGSEVRAIVEPIIG